MLLVAQNLSFKFACRTNKKKKEQENAERRAFVDLRLNLLAKRWMEKKGGEKEEQESEARPNPMKMFRVIVNSFDATIYPLIGGQRRGREGHHENGRGCLEGVTRGKLTALRVSRSLRLRRFSGSLRRVYGREQLSIGLKGSPGYKL